MAAKLGASAQSNNQFLAGLGAPQGGLVDPGKATAAGNVAYGLGGYMPAANLAREGAAFTAAAQQMPGNTLAQGQQDFTSNIFAGNKEQQQFHTQLKELEAKFPGVLNDVLDHLTTHQDALRTSGIQQSAADVNRAIAISQLTGKVGPQAAGLLGIPAGTPTATAAAATARLRAATAAAKARGEAPDAGLSKLLGVLVDKTGSPILVDGKPYQIASAAKAPKVSSGLSQKLGFLVDQSGNPILKGGQKVSVPMTSPPKPLSVKDRSVFEAKAWGAARRARSGFTTVDPKTDKPVTHPPISWQDYLSRGLAAGIPANILIGQGRKVFPKAERH
jgi:hypothetical protein